MSLVRWDKGTTHFKSSEDTATVARAARKSKRKQRLDDAYEVVDKRDRGVCWVTGRVTLTGDVGPETHRDHHHLAGRNVRPEWKYDPDRIITVCHQAHRLITTGKIVVEGDDARKPIFFHWHEDVTPRQKILVIKRRNVRAESEE